MTIKTRLQKLEVAQLAEMRAEFSAAITPWFEWITHNTTEAERAAYHRALWQAWGLPADPQDGDPQPDDRAVAEAIERRAPYELIDRVYKALGAPGAPFPDNRKTTETITPA